MFVTLLSCVIMAWTLLFYKKKLARKARLEKEFSEEKPVFKDLDPKEQNAELPAK